MQSPKRFSSCRGVSFEIKTHPYPITTKTTRNNSLVEVTPTTIGSNGLLQFSWMSNPSIQRSTSFASSHFCDVENDEDNVENDEDEVLETLEDGGKQEHVQKKQVSSRLSIILLDQGLFTVYKRLFVSSFTLNIIFLVLATTGHFPYARSHSILFSIANILALTLCRSEAFLRIIFFLAVEILGRPIVPLRIKTLATSFLQSLGGLHSGCAISSIAWLIYSLVLAIKETTTSRETIVIAYAILSLLFLSSLSAFPLVRHLHHNVFERAHRLSGWTALGLLWAFLLLSFSYNPTTKSYSKQLLASTIIKKQEFWFTLSTTVLIILPWLSVKRVPVKISSPSSHAAIIKFQGGVQAGLLGRISPSPLSEWHPFGIVSDGKNEHFMLAGAVGDFTKTLVSTSPPSHLWIRQVRFAGLPYLTNMYNKVLLVATGSGICVFLSFILQSTKAEVFLLWVAKDIEANFGSEINEMVSKEKYHDRVIVHDTSCLGRPDISKMTVDASRKWGVEVVIVTSNPEGSRDVVNSCKAVGIPAFGPIWDS